MNVTYRPVGADWPGQRTPGRERVKSRFQRTGHWNHDTHQHVGGGKVPWPDTLGLLDRELRELGAASVVFQIDVRESDIRLDGMPSARARPTDPGVIISFRSRHGPLRYFCDRFTDWQDNVRAVALGLEALRKVERYGITHRGEQYVGWKALPASSGQVEGVIRQFGSVAEAAAYLIEKAGDNASLRGVVEDKQYRDDVFRRAAKRVHPDGGGNRADWDALVEARRLIESSA